VPEWVDPVRRILAGELTVPFDRDTEPTEADTAAASAVGLDPMAMSYLMDVWVRESGRIAQARAQAIRERRANRTVCGELILKGRDAEGTALSTTCTRAPDHLGNHREGP
jgi:hypothetical protein